MHRSPINLADPVIDGDAPGALNDILAADVSPRDGGPSRMSLCLMLAVTSIVNLIVRSRTGEKATGSITVVGGADLADENFFTIDDGFHAPVPFEFDDNAALAEAGAVGITFTGAETPEEVRDLVVDAINGAGLYITATADPENVDVVLLEHQRNGEIGNVTITEDVTNAGFEVAGMVGGEGFTAILPLNAGVAIAADTFHTLEVWIDHSLMYNLQLETDGAIPYLLAVEEK